MSEIANLELNSLSPKNLAEKIANSKNTELASYNINEVPIEERKYFGSKNIGDIHKFLTDEYITAVKSSREDTTAIGLLRGMLMFSDIEKYFSNPVHRKGVTSSSYNTLLYKDENKTKRDIQKTRHTTP